MDTAGIGGRLYIDANGGREGKLYLIDDCPYVLIEDNGDRGIFQAVGPLVSTMPIKPTTVARFKDIKEVN